MVVYQNEIDDMYKYSYIDGDDYWVLHHYKTSDLKDVSANDR